MVSCVHPGAFVECGQTALHRTGETKALCDRVGAAMKAAGYAGPDIFAVRLALEEATVNAIKHGHQGDAAKTVQVTFRVTAEQVLLTVEDEGEGFDPRLVADPLSPENIDRSSGRGLLLMRHYMTWVKYNDRGNMVSLCKCRTF
jgi:serine/threonine-protein kinase RsbW